MSDLLSKSLTTLRGIAQSYDVQDIFQKDVLQLVQAIEMKKVERAAPVVDVPTKPEYDARLMTKIPAKRSDVDLAQEVLSPYVKRGLSVSFDENEETWSMAFADRRDTGTLRQPPIQIARCAERLLRG